MRSTSTGVEVPPGVSSFLEERLGSAVGRVRIRPLAGDASTRRYFRLEHEGGGTEVLAANPEPFDPDALPFLAVQGLLAGWGLPVPRVLAVDGARGIVLQQDLGDVSLQQALESASGREREDRYREALGQLVRLQRESERGPRDAACFSLAFDVEKLTWELDFFLTHFVCGLRAATLDEAGRAELREAFGALCREIASWPRVLCHRDFHGHNLMLHGGTLHWIDFQDARMGPPTYDVASLLRERNAPLCDEVVLELAEGFRREALPDEAPDVFARRFGLVSIQRTLKALGSFGFMVNVRGYPRYLTYVETALGNVRRELVRHPGLDGLRRALCRHIEELG
jgi:aminoglycoside/choline kinase family phosphotransferase